MTIRIDFFFILQVYRWKILSRAQIYISYMAIKLTLFLHFYTNSGCHNPRYTITNFGSYFLKNRFVIELFCTIFPRSKQYFRCPLRRDQQLLQNATHPHHVRQPPPSPQDPQHFNNRHVFFFNFRSIFATFKSSIFCLLSSLVP